MKELLVIQTLKHHQNVAGESDRLVDLEVAIFRSHGDKACVSSYSATCQCICLAGYTRRQVKRVEFRQENDQRPRNSFLSPIWQFGFGVLRLRGGAVQQSSTRLSLPLSLSLGAHDQKYLGAYILVQTLYMIGQWPSRIAC